MYLWESDIQESVVFKPVEIRGKRGRKKLKKSNAAIYIPNMDADNFEKICNENGLKFVYVEVPPHGDLIDRDDLTLCDYDIDGGTDSSGYFSFKAVPEETLNDAQVIIPAEK